jgi:hypothetical protein
LLLALPPIQNGLDASLRNAPELHSLGAGYLVGRFAMDQLAKDEEVLAARRRFVAIRLAALTLRLRHCFIKLFGSPDEAAIMLAVGVIRSERLLRDDLETNYRAFKGDVPEDLLAPCNIASIAAASGFNRETTRRKVDRLVEAGKLVRDGQVVKYDQRFFKQETFLKMVDAELDDVLKTTNELLRDGVVQVHRSVQNRSIKAESR